MSNVSPVSVLCVDDNPEIAAAVRVQLSCEPGFAWAGSLSAADTLLEVARREHPGIVLLDIDMPGRSPFEALTELADRVPDSRAIIFTGHVRRDLVERALDAGAWGYVSKNDSEEELLAALRQVAAGEFALSTEPRQHFESR